MLTLVFIEVGQNLADFSNDLDVVLPMAYLKDWDFDADWVSNNLIHEVEHKRAAHGGQAEHGRLGRDCKECLDPEQSTKRYPGVACMVWFSAVYWQPQQTARIVTLYQRAATMR